MSKDGKGADNGKGLTPTDKAGESKGGAKPLGTGKGGTGPVKGGKK